MSFRFRGIRGSQPIWPGLHGAAPWARFTGASRYARSPFFHPTTPAKFLKAQRFPEGVKPLAEHGVSGIAFPPLARAAGTMAQSVVQVLAEAHEESLKLAGGW
jgi:hypothetical protein